MTAIVGSVARCVACGAGFSPGGLSYFRCDNCARRQAEAAERRAHALPAKRRWWRPNPREPPGAKP
jgi:hypothetical protein